MRGKKHLGERKTVFTYDITPSTKSLSTSSLYNDQESFRILFPLLKRRRHKQIMTTQLIKDVSRARLHVYTSLCEQTDTVDGWATFAPPHVYTCIHKA